MPRPRGPGTRRVNVLARKKDGGLTLDIDPDAPLEGEQTLLVIGREKDVRMILK